MSNLIYALINLIVCVGSGYLYTKEPTETSFFVVQIISFILAICYIWCYKKEQR